MLGMWHGVNGVILVALHSVEEELNTKQGSVTTPPPNGMNKAVPAMTKMFHTKELLAMGG